MKQIPLLLAAFFLSGCATMANVQTPFGDFHGSAGYTGPFGGSHGNGSAYRYQREGHLAIPNYLRHEGYYITCDVLADVGDMDEVRAHRARRKSAKAEFRGNTRRKRVMEDRVGMRTAMAESQSSFIAPGGVCKAHSKAFGRIYDFVVAVSVGVYDRNKNLITGFSVSQEVGRNDVVSHVAPVTDEVVREALGR